MENPELLATYTCFEACRSTLYTIVLGDDSSGPELTQAQQSLSIAFAELLTAFSPLADHRVRAGLTEVHRLLKLVDRDLQFWRSAKQPNTREERREQLLAKLGQIAEWEKVFEIDRH